MNKQNLLMSADSALNKAHYDEPIFLLRAKDPAAAMAVRHWVAMANEMHEPNKLEEAQDIANAMDSWRQNFNMSSGPCDCPLCRANESGAMEELLKSLLTDSLPKDPETVGVTVGGIDAAMASDNGKPWDAKTGLDKPTGVTPGRRKVKLKEGPWEEIVEQLKSAMEDAEKTGANELTFTMMRI